MEQNTTIRITIELWRRLNVLKERPDDTYSIVIERLLAATLKS